MSSTDHAREPTMEEILASIRRIISDDTEETEAEPAAEAEDAVEAGDGAGFDSMDPGKVEETAPEPEEDVLELTDVVDDEEADTVDADFDFDSIMVDDEEDEEEEREEKDEPEAAAGDVEFVDMEQHAGEADVGAMAEFETPKPANGQGGMPESGLLSQESDQMVAAAFGRLASTLLARDGNARTLEDLVQELLRPMLKSWLDENLPRVVEELVRQEIERVSRRGGR